MAVALTGNDVAQVNERVLSALADGDSIAVEALDDLGAIKAAKNGNILASEKRAGQAVKVSLRILIGSADDKFLNSLMALQTQDFSGISLLTGCFSKRVGDGQGNISTNVYQCANGIIQRVPSIKSSSEGDVEQSVKVYIIVYGNCAVSIQ